MPKKKANGEGSIYRCKYGWAGQISVGRNDKGKIKRKTFYGKTKMEVSNKMNEYKIKNLHGEIPIDDKINIKDYFYKYLFEYRIHDLKPASFTKYEGIYRKYLKGSSLGKVKLYDFRTSHLQNYYNSLLAEDKDVSTIKTINKTLKTCLNHALKNEYITRNYCTLVTLPKEKVVIGEEESISIFTLEEQQKFISSLKSNRIKPFISLAFATGLRLGELLALKWDDINFDDKTASVNKSLKSVYVFDSKGDKTFQLAEQLPKTKSSIRTLPIPDVIIKGLYSHKLNLHKEKLKLGELYADNDYVFPSKTGTPLNERNIRRSYERALKSANIPYRKFHSIRYSYATRLFENNVPIKTVQSLMGHSDIKTTMNIYTHVTKDKQIEAVETLNKIFG